MEKAADYTRRLLNKGVQARKSLGQNFLIDDYVIEQIAEVSDLERETKLLEVGPGLGVLTRVLAGLVDQMWAIELDKAKVDILKKELAGLPVEIIHQDALKLDLKTLWGDEPGYLIGNLPYYITSPLLMHFLEQSAELRGMTVMVQKEVAERLSAVPGSKQYGVLSVAVQLSAEVEEVLSVPPEAFSPAPKVHSTVVRLKLRPYPGLTVHKEKIMRIVKAAFGQRRKTLNNSLAAVLGLEKGLVSEAVRQSGIDGQRRAETLTIDEFQSLAESFSSILEWKN